MATVATQPIGKTGTVPTYSAADAAGDRVSPGQGTFVHVRNGGTAAITATIATPVTFHGQAVADVTSASIAAGGEAFIPLTDAALYRDPADGLAGISWSAVTTVTFAALRA
jgi:hypothetical protein